MSYMDKRAKHYRELEENYDNRIVPSKTSDSSIDDVLAVRIDGRAFHTLTKRFAKPFDPIINTAMQHACESVENSMPQKCFITYTASDEITIFSKLRDANDLIVPFSGRVEKIASIAASAASAGFYSTIAWDADGDGSRLTTLPTFDARVFVLNKNEILDYISWRRSNAYKNAVSSVSECIIGKEMIHGTNTSERLAMLDAIDPYIWKHSIDSGNKYGFIRYDSVEPRHVCYVDGRTGKTVETIANRTVRKSEPLKNINIVDEIIHNVFSNCQAI